MFLQTPAQNPYLSRTETNKWQIHRLVKMNEYINKVECKKYTKYTQFSYFKKMIRSYLKTNKIQATY